MVSAECTTAVKMNIKQKFAKSSKILSDLLFSSGLTTLIGVLS